MSLDPATGRLDCEMRIVPEVGVRWFDGKLQQAWAPVYGGGVEWRDVPVVSSTAGGVADVSRDPDEGVTRDA